MGELIDAEEAKPLMQTQAARLRASGLTIPEVAEKLHLNYREADQAVAIGLIRAVEQPPEDWKRLLLLQLEEVKQKYRKEMLMGKIGAAKIYMECIRDQARLTGNLRAMREPDRGPEHTLIEIVEDDGSQSQDPAT